MAPPPGRIPIRDPSRVPRVTAGQASLISFFFRKNPEILLFSALQGSDNFAYPEKAHGQCHETDAVGKLGNVEGEALIAAGDVGPDHPEKQTQDNHSHCLYDGARSKHDGADQAEDHEGEVLRWSELEGQFRQGNGQDGDKQGGKTTSDKRSQG
jgi:hypothetical protein